jgi:addiction module HigA family antidote
MSREALQPQLEVGAFIRKQVLPSGMAVTEAAKRLGVSRPALSNLLNGNAALSPEMAFKLETAFGADRQELLDLQARALRGAHERVSAANVYVPNFLTIKARQIANWVENNIEARQHLAVLLRKLVQSTGIELREVDFPGFDNAERKGWDGRTETRVATPWIPEGRSGWEFGTDRNPREKADKDYAARLASVPPTERAQCTLVFVTPRNWPGKVDWARTKDAAGEWKAVKAFDASDLEQWLEGSISAQIWLAEQLGLPVSGFETLDHFWERWAAASKPRMTPEIFAPSIAAYRNALKTWLEKDPEELFIVAGDSKEEALAFLACLFRDEAVAPRLRDLAAIFESQLTIRTLATSSAPFIPIVHTEEAERELTTVYRRLHCIAVRPRNAVGPEPNIALDLLRHEAFEKALASMDIRGDKVERLAAESGYSPTILRRRLSPIGAVKVPLWAQDHDAARSLIPMALIGAWHAKSSADCEILSVLARRPYPQVEESVTRLRQYDDPPIWSAGEYRGVTSKIDALFAISPVVTPQNLTDFLTLAENALSETDPALELPEDQRWAAGIYGKVRGHSTALREGICETLVLLSVHGNNLFHDRLGLDVRAQVSLLIRKLLTPLTLEKLLSQDHGLPRYAEAAPEEFLSLIVEDLKQSEPVVLGLLTPAAGFFSGPSRTGLLWALECLAWKPQNLARVSLILARLAKTKIEDNWVNKPISSLAAIYRCWMPQTAASIDERVQALRTLNRLFPDIGWQICIRQFELGPQTGFNSYRPRWRSDASGVGQVVSRKEAWEFSRKALEFALAWRHNAQTLSDLVERLDGMSDEDQRTVWSLIDTWAKTGTDESAKAQLRERVRRFAFTRRGKLRGLSDTTRDRSREAYERLAPADPVIRHRWLFEKQWVEESVEEMEDDSHDFAKREQRIEQLRAQALQEIWSQQGFDGVAALLASSEASPTIGRHIAPCASDTSSAVDFLHQCLSLTGDLVSKADGCIQGFLFTISADSASSPSQARR